MEVKTKKDEPIQAAHDQEVVGLNPGTLYWMDVSVASYYINIHKNNENKGSQMGHTTRKYFFKEGIANIFIVIRIQKNKKTFVMK